MKIKNRPFPERWFGVESSNIKAMQYWAPGQTLWLLFTGKDVDSRYRYDGVPNDKVTEFLQADSKGSFVHKELKGKFEVTKEI